MFGFGENLRAERLARGISLEEISEATNIGVRLLHAIEDRAVSFTSGWSLQRKLCPPIREGC